MEFSAIMAGAPDYLFLDQEGTNVRILIRPDDKKDFQCWAANAGWKSIKDRSKDEYLYGMEHFLYYAAGQHHVTVCCQVACRSTLNGEWVPLDRIINLQAVDHGESHQLCDVDRICYLLAKGVYTEKCFSDADKKELSSLLLKADPDALQTKLKMVFFRFAEKMAELAKQGRFDELSDALWKFAAY